MVFPIFSEEDFYNMIDNSVDNVLLVEDVTAHQFKILFVIIIIPLNCNIWLEHILKMFEKSFQNSMKFLQGTYQKKSDKL